MKIFFKGIFIVTLVIFLLPAGSVMAEKLTLRFGHIGEPGSYQYEVPEKLKENIDELSDGKIQLQIFPNSQLGNLPQMMGQMRKGSLDIFYCDYFLAILMEKGKPFMIGLAPYLFKDNEHLERFIDSDIFKDMMGEVEDANNCKWLGFLGHRSPRALSIRNKMVVTPENMKGLKFRAPKVPGINDTLEHWGASTAAIAVAEIYNALKQKVVDGQENGMETVYGYKFYEVQKYYCGIDYIRSGLGWWMNGDKWNSLTQEQQDILIEAGEKTAKWASSYLKAKTDEWFETCRENGMVLVLPPLEPWIESVQPVINDLDGKAWPAGLYEKISNL